MSLKVFYSRQYMPSFLWPPRTKSAKNIYWSCLSSVSLCVFIFIFTFMCAEVIGQPWVLFSDIIHLFICCLFWGRVSHWPGVVHPCEPASASSVWGYKRRVSPDFSCESWGSNSSPYASVASSSQMVLAPRPSLSFSNFLRHFTYVSFHWGRAPVSQILLLATLKS